MGTMRADAIVCLIIITWKTLILSFLKNKYLDIDAYVEKHNKLIIHIRIPKGSRFAIFIINNI